jgi:chitin disaccharide deacetylase
MQPNPVLKRLGLSDTDRVAIIHLDDVGMFQSSVSAYQDLMAFGLVTSAAVMVPCPWFSATAAYLRDHPEFDMGVHITLNSEWDAFRWGPISTRDTASGMIDSEGYFYRTEEEVRQNGSPDAVKSEILAQIQRALDAGIKPTHIDSHMGTVFHHKYLPPYIAAAQQHRLAAFMMRTSEEELRQTFAMHDETAQVAGSLVKQLEGEQFPLVDYFVTMPLDTAFAFSERIDVAKTLIADFKPGVTHFILHAAHDTPELRAGAFDWQARVGDLQVFLSDELRRFIQAQGIHVVGYRALQALV